MKAGTSKSKVSSAFLYFWNEKRFIVLDKGSFTVGRAQGDLVNAKDSD